MNAKVRSVFRSIGGIDGYETCLQPGEAISFGIEFAVRRDAPLSETPIGPILVCLEDLEAARFLEVFLDRDLMVPAGQVKPIEGPTMVPQMSLHDRDLEQLAATYIEHRRKVQDLVRETAHVDEIVLRAIDEHGADAFEPSGVTVFQYGDTHVVRIMLPPEYPDDLGSLRRLVKDERSVGHVSEANARICCTRQRVVRRVTHDGRTSVFLA